MAGKKTAAHEDLLGRLHSMTATAMMAMLEGGEFKAADLAVIVKFLKDNNIQCDVSDENMRNLARATRDNVVNFPFGTAVGEE
jgi:hypothetical protein